MDVERPVSPSVEERRWQNEAIGGGDERVGPGRSHTLDLLDVFEVRRLKYLDTLGRGEALYRARNAMQSSTGRAVRLRQDQRNFVACAHQARQGTLGELGRASED
jgi:hypothetical protein